MTETRGTAAGRSPVTSVRDTRSAGRSKIAPPLTGTAARPSRQADRRPPALELRGQGAAGPNVRLMSPAPAGPSCTPKQGQYVAFIYAYTRVLGRPPA